VGYDKIYREGKKVLMNILDIEVPVIAGVNGPVRLHSEYILLADIVLATPSTVFQDKPHFEFGIVPGDWRQPAGPKSSGAYAAVTSFSHDRSLVPRRQRNGARSMKSCPPTGCWHAPERSQKDSSKLHTHEPLHSDRFDQKLRRIIDEGVGYSLALEGISAADIARSMANGPLIKGNHE